MSDTEISDTEISDTEISDTNMSDSGTDNLESLLRDIREEDAVLNENRVLFKKDKAEFEKEKAKFEQEKAKLAEEKAKLEEEKAKLEQDKAGSSSEAQRDNTRLEVLEHLTGAKCYVCGQAPDEATNIELAIFVLENALRSGGDRMGRFHHFRLNAEEDEPLCLYGVMELGHEHPQVARQLCCCPRDIYPYSLKRTVCGLQVTPLTHEEFAFIFDAAVYPGIGVYRRNCF
ncbi:hypothetical protein QC762_101444 [Podospora pseudocomata]|uniref:Uncharacterized protein n=1 Tax=Podospora pseudocomata TaxID=2093779 RepID=A0ABR0GRK3_9PEZI|nr:hypothetical protein QC762_101444 [Podospora pseudocomata]